jgi:hypothetical protein
MSNWTFVPNNNLACLIFSAYLDCKGIPHTESSCILKVIINLECAVEPLLRRSAAIPEDATDIV